MELHYSQHRGFQHCFVLNSLLLSLLFAGCFSEPIGVFCVTNADCSSRDCYNGVCVAEPIVTDSETNELDSRAVGGLDILFVVDNSGTTGEEQGVFNSAIFTLFNKLQREIRLNDADVDFELGWAVITADMGVGYIDETIRDESALVSCGGLGDNGKMRTRYFESGDGIAEIPVQEELIQCREDDSSCPPDWVCTQMDQDGVGVCTPVYSDTNVACSNVAPFLSNDMYLTVEELAYLNEPYSGFATAAACLANVGIEGCSIGSPLHAAYAGMTKHGQEIFLRKDALTLIVVVTNGTDCSVGEKTFEEDKGIFASPEASPQSVCNNDKQLIDPRVVRKKILEAKSKAIGENADDTIAFAAILGVPMVPSCQGRGDRIDGCLNVSLPDGGTVGEPNRVQRLDSSGNQVSDFEYACETVDEQGMPVTQAYSASRIVEVAQLFGEAGFVYSVCNKDWTPAMMAIGEMILERMDL